MLAGGDILPFNASKLERLTVSFVPHENVTTLPPTTGDIIYNVTIANSTGTLYSNQFVDSDGILDLEFVPITQTEHFVNWGPGHRGHNIEGSEMTEHFIFKVLC